MAPLDRWLPDFQVREYHEVEVEVSPVQAMEALLSGPAAPDRLVRALFRLRGLRGWDTSLSRFLEDGFLSLERTLTLLVAGMGRAGAPFDASRIKIAVEFHAEEIREGRSRLATETRVCATDAHARRVFRGYWLVVGPFSALIRRRWLRAAAMASAKRSAAPLP